MGGVDGEVVGEREDLRAQGMEQGPGELVPAVVTEQVFSLPGMGQLLVESIFQRDYPVIQGINLIIVTIIVITNLGVDLLYAVVDPRIRY